MVAIGARDPSRAAALHAGRAVAGYQEVLDDPEVEAVYVPLPNHLHREWCLRALAAGKHVLCEKPLALSAAEGVEIAERAAAVGRLAMEAAMYRFNPRVAAVAASLRADPPPALWAGFGFPLAADPNYRWQPEMGGGALLDVGFYTISLARWTLGEPDWVEATARFARGTGIDVTVSITLGFPGGALAFLFASFETPEIQDLRAGAVRLDRPFTFAEPGIDPYRLMVESFSAAALNGSPAPLALEDSIANLRVIDGVRRSLRLGRRYHLAEFADPDLPAGQ